MRTDPLSMWLSPKRHPRTLGPQPECCFRRDSQLLPEDMLTIHGFSAKGYQALYLAMVEPTYRILQGPLPTRSSLELGKIIQQKLWVALLDHITSLENDQRHPQPGKFHEEPEPKKWLKLKSEK